MISESHAVGNFLLSLENSLFFIFFIFFIFAAWFINDNSSHELERKIQGFYIIGKNSKNNLDIYYIIRKITEGL